ncbi:MAG TPA: helix-turn-helix domain-containing protein [Woeseiaceae bacterium]|nr:helix-turn-helix domain-containing protein [Woeseiaceae bacterium]
MPVFLVGRATPGYDASVLQEKAIMHRMDESSDSPAAQDSATLRLHDVDELNHAVSGSDLELMQLKPGKLEATLRQVTLADFSIDQSIVNQPVRVRGRLDSQRYCIGLIPQHSRATWSGIPVNKSRLLFFRRGAELNGHVSANYNSTSLVVPPHWIESIEQNVQQSGAFEFGCDFAPVRPDPLRHADLWRAARAIFMPAPPASNVIDRERWLLADIRNCLGAALITLDTAPQKSCYQALAHFSFARRAEAYMRERISEPVSIDELCVALHVSRRYLEYAFSGAFGTSPSRYLRLLRLNEVRRRLQTPGAATTVTGEASNFGFSHLSQFAVQYKQLFGQSPSATLADARDTNPE